VRVRDPGSVLRASTEEIANFTAQRALGDGRPEILRNEISPSRMLEIRSSSEVKATTVWKQ